MCWNATVSLNTFAFALFVIVLAYVNSYASLTVCALYLLFAGIQLVEGLVWLTLDTNGGWNVALAVAAYVIIWLQPIASLLSVRGRDALRNKLAIAYVGSMLALSIAWWLWDSSPTDFRMVPSSNGHLEWKWMSPLFGSPIGIAMISLWLFFFLLPAWLNGTYHMLVLGLVTFFISLYTFAQARTVGSMWCWIANLLFVVILLDILFMQPCMQTVCNFKKKITKR